MPSKFNHILLHIDLYYIIFGEIDEKWMPLYVLGLTKIALYTLFAQINYVNIQFN